MKKSKILVPAMAVLTLSTAAAVTGTVAWYFSSRTASIQASAITSFNPEAGLKVTLTAGQGTTVDTASSTVDTTPATVTHDLMRDASVDVENGKVYRVVLDREGNPVEYKEVTELKDGTNTESKDYYFATTYTAKFELNNATSGKTYALYYDNSKLTASGEAGVKESLRIGFKFGTDFFVVAPFRTELAKAQAYIKAGAVAQYADAKLFLSGEENLTGLNNSVDDADKATFEGYMGTLVGTGNITATVYTWFEGNDEKSDAELVDDKALTAKFNFTLAEVIEA